MAEIHEEYKRWVNYLQKSDLENIITSLKNIKNIKQDTENNKYLFKLLLHLSHYADRCSREKISKEVEIFIIAYSICENLSSIPDKNKLFSAIYYILYYLLNKQCFKEAKVISNYLFPGKILNNNDFYESSKYNQIASLWQIEIFKNLDILIAKSKVEKVEINEEFSFYIKFNLQILKFCNESLRFTFKAIEAYIIKLSSFSLGIAFPHLLTLFKYLSNYICNSKNVLIEEAYNYTILMISTAFYKRNDTINNLNVLNYFQQCDSHLLEALKISSQCYSCYKFYREYSINLFETNFMSNEIGETRLKSSFEILQILLQKYGENNNIIIETVNAVAYSFEILFNNWENLVSKNFKNTNINHNDVILMGNFVKKVHRILMNRSFPITYICKKCPESVECPVKEDIYNASVICSTYIRVISKFSADILNDEIFSITKDLIKELILVYKKLDQLGCRYSSPMWDLCGKTIFNIGLISESKYPEELEELYEELCIQVVQRDGFNSKFSSFGLENPVNTALHRLCKSNFNQEKYRKALSYTAYNALLSNCESRKKKAYDMWTQIKSKFIDSKEIQELTMLKCLKKDSEIVRRLGINVNIDHYDLSDLCYRELKSLILVKGNAILSMKKILNELEFMNDGLHYAQGVLLLCFHALQLSKREYISDYISKAIEKLNNKKLKTSDNQCLLANLNFFAIIEKLYVRSQAIDNQVDDASFTIKAFKMMKGLKLDDDIEDQNEIVPTYGGISIEEDNRCAKELRDVLTLWENCLHKNLSDNNWESKFTLETIIICGEYCRLYKFNDIEGKIWKLAYKLATALQDFTTCIYVTSRSISLRCINDAWIGDAEKYVINIMDSNKIAEIDIVAIFWLSLAEFYIDCKKIEESKILLEKVKTLSNYEMLSNSKIYIYSKYIQFRNYYLLNTKTSQEEYCQLLVEIHYLMINLHDIINQDICRFWNIRFQLFTCEQIFEAMYTVIIPMNSLLSYREVSAHLSHGLKLAQKLGITLRIAQHLKYFCYIDLLRMQVENCETRLQDLEHILCLEHFHMSMKTKFKKEANIQVTSTQMVRDAKNSASPELKKKVFSPPDFLIHTSHCQCFICTNLHYQYLTFSCTHIRAQLYSLLKYVEEAEQYFYGACKIKLKIDEKDSPKTRQYKNYKWKRYQDFTIDSLLYLLDFSMFIIDFKSDQNEDALSLIEEILEIATKNDLTNHYTYIYATELYFQYYIYDIFQDKLSIFVPQDIPINITNRPVEGCITPKQQTEKISQKPRRRKSPPAISAITIAITNDDENNCENFPIANDALEIKKRSTKRTGTKNVRRKILEDEIEGNVNAEEKAEQPQLQRKRSTRLLAKKSFG